MIYIFTAGETGSGLNESQVMRKIFPWNVAGSGKETMS